MKLIDHHIVIRPNTHTVGLIDKIHIAHFDSKSNSVSNLDFFVFWIITKDL